jgi:hypothetical protein
MMEKKKLIHINMPALSVMQQNPAGHTTITRGDLE